jgi:ankyrin repeat protein
LHKAVTDNNLEMATLLLKAGAYVDVRDGQDWTPLHRAVVQGKQDMAELLRAHGAWLTRRRFGQSLVMLAMYGNQKEMVKFLIDKGIRRWHSPVHLAAFFGGLDEVKSYLAAGGDIDAQDPFDQLTLLMCAMYGEQTDVIEFLISKGADLNLQDCQGLTALHRAVADHPEIARLLLDKGADVTIRGDFGATPLTRAVFFSDVEMLKMLIAKGADVNIRFGFTDTGNIGSTVLHRACRTGDKAKAEVLIAHSADVNAKNHNGHTPMSLAKRSGNEQLVELLRKHGAKE